MMTVLKMIRYKFLTLVSDAHLECLDDLVKSNHSSIFSFGKENILARWEDGQNSNQLQPNNLSSKNNHPGSLRLNFQSQSVCLLREKP